MLSEIFKELSPNDRRDAWKTFAMVLGTEPRPDNVIRGISGLSHELASLSVDEKHNRLLIVPNEVSARTTALIRADIQATMPETRVIAARPVTFDLGYLIRAIFSSADNAHNAHEMITELLKETQPKPKPRNTSKKKRKSKSVKAPRPSPVVTPIIKQIGAAAEPLMRAAIGSGVSPYYSIQEVLYQLSILDWHEILQTMDNETGIRKISLRRLYEHDNFQRDREFGICSIPLYDFDEDIWEALLYNANHDDVRETLKKLNVYQYFFPPPDSTALGFVDHGLQTPETVIEALERAGVSGHPPGRNEILSDPHTLPELVDALKDRNLLVEGEVGLEKTAEGEIIRSTVRFTPRESIFQVLARQFGVKINIDAKVSASATEIGELMRTEKKPDSGESLE